MASTLSKMVPLGTIAPDFTLPDVVTGSALHLKAEAPAKATIIMFICNHCPYVKHLLSGIIDLVNDYLPKGVKAIAISSNDVLNYPDDSPEEMKKLALELKFPFPYLYDESQEVAKAYDAACTPDFYVFDKDLKLAYRGQFDDARRSNNIPVTGKDIRKALDSLLAGKPVDPDQIPGIGCNIKWK